MVRPSVLLITIDTLRADRVGGALTPEINAIAARGVTFTTVRATAPLTLPSHATIMTGMLPPEHGARQNGEVVPTDGVPRLARTFRDQGYRTAAFVGAYVLDRRFGLAEGFDHYDDRIPRPPNASTRFESERNAADVAAAACEWLNRAPRDRPLFAWVHFYDPHAPYQPPPEHLSRAGGRAYDGEVSFADAQVRAVADGFRAAVAQEPLLAIVGDHGEGLGDHGETTHGMLAYDSTLRVPLVITGPGVQQNQRVTKPATLRDLPPTLLARAGLAIPREMTGRDLLGSSASEVYAETVYPQTAGWSPLRVLVDDRWKMIGSSQPELYDVTRDAGEERDLAAQNPSVVTAMRNRADKIFTAARQSAGAPSTGDAAERLRALGYVAASPSTRAESNAPNPRDTIALWNRFESALSKIAAGQSAQALPELRALSREAPDARVFQSSLAQALKDTGRAREAFTLLRQLAARWPQDATIFHDLAVAAREVGDAAEAARAEQAALALNPNDANAHNGLGLLHADAGRDREASAAFDRATRLDPNNASFWTNLGNARRGLGDVPGAQRAYERALEIDASHADAANGIGVILVQQQRAADAIAYFERAIAADPALTSAQLNLGIAFQESGQAARAADQYRKVIKTAPAGTQEKRAASALLAALRSGH